MYSFQKSKNQIVTSITIPFLRFDYGMLAQRFVFCAKPFAKHIREILPRTAPVLDSLPFRHFAISRSTLEEISNDPEDDISEKTQDKRIIQLSRYVMNNNLKSSLVTYSKLPLFLPRSDFRIVCSLMKHLGTSSGIPDLENVFLKIQRMKLSRKHALTMRCLIRLSYEIGDAELIETFYRQICEEEIYVNNSFLNDVTFDCLFSLNAYKTICTIVQSLQVVLHFPLDCVVSAGRRQDSPLLQQPLQPKRTHRLYGRRPGRPAALLPSADQDKLANSGLDHRLHRVQRYSKHIPRHALPEMSRFPACNLLLSSFFLRNPPRCSTRSSTSTRTAATSPRRLASCSAPKTPA